jgi:hypothetical protein
LPQTFFGHLDQHLLTVFQQALKLCRINGQAPSENQPQSWLVIDQPLPALTHFDRLQLQLELGLSLSALGMLLHLQVRQPLLPRPLVRLPQALQLIRLSRPALLLFAGPLLHLTGIDNGP